MKKAPTPCACAQLKGIPMNMKHLALSLLCVAGGLKLQAGELTPEVTGKFLKVIVSTSGQGKIACADAPVKAALENLGVTVDSTASIIWCTSPVDAKMQKNNGKMVVVGRRDLGPFACIIIEEEGGRPKLILNTTNIRSSKVTLSDALMKIGEKL
jgi:hypothetical protein